MGIVKRRVEKIIEKVLKEAKLYIQGWAMGSLSGKLPI